MDWLGAGLSKWRSDQLRHANDQRADERLRSPGGDPALMSEANARRYSRSGGSSCSAVCGCLVVALTDISRAHSAYDQREYIDIASNATGMAAFDCRVAMLFVFRRQSWRSMDSCWLKRD